jgi:hypothetical protein
MVDIVAGDDYEVTPTEAFILGGAILVHDLAMSQAAFQNEFVRLKTEPIWRDTVATHLRAKLKRTPTADQIANPDQAGEREAIQTLLRELHARQAAVLPTKEWGYAGTNYYLLEDADLRAAFGEDIGKVAFSHHWPLSELLNPASMPQKRSGGPGWLPREWTVDLVKLACLLRTADACHADDRRAPGFLAALRQPSGISSHHWLFQSLMRSPDRDGDRIRYRSNRPFKIDEADAWWVGYDWLCMVDRELRAVDALLADTRRPRLAVRGVWNVEDPGHLAEDLPTSEWEPVDVRLRIGDVAHLVRTLGGQQLYGNRLEVPLRELSQNAADAVRARRRLQTGFATRGRIVVRPGRDPATGREWIEVEDDGVGMSKGVLTETLLDFGAAFWGTGRMRQEFPGLQAAGMEAIGQFGIGFFSVFMWGDEVQVTTRRFDRGYEGTWVLEFRRGVGHRPWLRKATPEEQHSLPNGGTRVRVWCDPSKEVVTALLKRESPSTTSCSWVELCEWLAPALDVDLCVEENGVTSTAVRADDWLSLDAEAMLLRFNRKSADDATAIILQRHVEWRLISPFLQAVRDESGRPIARGTVWTLEPERFRTSLAVCGGLRTDGGANFLGIQFGRPETVARHLAISSDHRAGWIAWAEEQKRFDDPGRFTPLVRALAALRLCPFTDPGDMPIGFSQTGWVTLPQFMATIRDASAFCCIGTWLSAAPALLQHVPGMPFLMVNSHHVLNQIDNGGFRIMRLLRQAAEEQWATGCEMSDVNQGMRGVIVNDQHVPFHVVSFTRTPRPSGSPEMVASS